MLIHTRLSCVAEGPLITLVPTGGLTFDRICRTAGQTTSAGKQDLFFLHFDRTHRPQDQSNLSFQEP